MLDAIGVSDFGASWPESEPVHAIRVAVQIAWASVPRVPRSTDPKHPLVGFIHLALQAIGIKLTRNTISEILKRRRRLGHEGQGPSKKRGRPRT
jgi:hypothetical protein